MRAKCWLTHLPAIALALAGIVLDCQESWSQTVTIKTPLDWHKVADDLETAEVGYQTNAIIAGQVLFVRSELKRYRIGVIRAAEYGWSRATVKSLCKASKGAVCINANFFDESGDPLGLIISRGIEYHRLHKGGHTLTGIFEVTRHDITVVNRVNFTPDKVLEAVQAGPRLLANGAAIPGVSDERSSRRAGVCVDKHRRLLLFCTQSAITGLTIQELQGLLLAEPLGCVEALNLDGGGSAQLYISSALLGAGTNLQEVFLAGRDEVPVAVALFADSRP